jgi:hypothetical protein
MQSDIIFINSYDRVSGSTDNFTINVSNQIKSSIHYDKIALVNCSIPKSYYLINNTSNELIINEAGVDKYVYIQNGNYSLLSLCSYLNTSTNLSQYGTIYTYNFNPNIQTGKITITVSGNSGNNVIFKFSNDNNPALIIGFNEINYTFNSSITSPNICNLELTNSISICCDIVETEILFNITPNVLAYNYINYQNNSLDITSKKISKQITNNIRFYLVDNISNKAINLNGVNMSLSIVLITSDIKNTYYKVQLEDYLLNNYLKKIEMEKSELSKLIDKPIEKSNDKSIEKPNNKNYNLL